MQASQSCAVVYVDEVPTLKMRSRATNFVADIDLWPISTFAVADMVFYVADMVCGRYRCNSALTRKLKQTKKTRTQRPQTDTDIAHPATLKNWKSCCVISNVSLAA